MPTRSTNLLAHPPPVVRRLTFWSIAACLALSALAIFLVKGREMMGFPRTPWYRALTIAVAVAPIVVVAPLWARRVIAIRRAVRASGWRLCRQCAYDVSALAPTGTCPECGHPYDTKTDAAYWESVGIDRPAPPVEDPPVEDPAPPEAPAPNAGPHPREGTR
jgi:hypothetical protein